MKKLLATILSIVLLISVCPMGALTFTASGTSGNTTDFAGGSGTEDDPYLISTEDHLDNVRYYMSSHFKMINDIEITAIRPIGCDANYFKLEDFSGYFDGNGFSISGELIRVGTPDSYGTGSHYFGLFCSITGTVCNLHLSNYSLKCGDSHAYSHWYAGGIAAYNYGIIANCSVGGSIGMGYGEKYGGIASYNYGTIKLCANFATVREGWDDVAGIAAYNGTGGLITNCYNTGYIATGTTSSSDFRHRAAGISSLTEGGQILNCYNIGKIVGYRNTTIGGYNSNSYYLNESFHSYSSYSYPTGIELTDAFMKKKSSFVGFDFENVWTMGGDPDYPYPELQCFALSGDVGVKDDVAYLSTAEIDLSKIKKIDDTFTYEWIVDGQVTSTEKNYTFSSSEIGKTLKVSVTGRRDYNKGTLYSKEFVITKAIQPDEPLIPVLQSLDDKSFSVSTVATQEYSIDNVNWQKSGVFQGLDPNKAYTVYSRISENNLYLTGASKAVLNVTTNRRPITGVVNISGTSRYGDTLTADTSSVGPTGVTYSYEWKANGNVIGTANAYTVAKADIGKNITVSVKGTGDYIGTLTSASVSATKATVQLPNAPVVLEKTNTSVTLDAISDYEYSKDKTNWQDSPEFTRLNAATEYTFYQRAKETDTTFASKTSNGTKATTLKNSIAAPQGPKVINVTNTTVTLESTAGYEYSLDGIAWQTSNVFTGLSPFTEYSFCQRIGETDTDYASAQSGYTIAVTLKNTVDAPGVPVIESATDDSVTLIATDGYEYSKNGIAWQKSNIFNNLEVLETYTFYQRVAETETDYASEKSEGTSFKVKFFASKPAAPTLVEVTNDKIVVETKEGYQYSIDETNWRKQGVFTGLNPNTAYAIRCRMPENDTYYASKNSNPLQVTTLKNVTDKPGAPFLTSKTADTVTLLTISGYEYSKDGVNWQTSNVFENLSPHTEYTFYQRIAETETSYTSGTSAGLTVITLKYPVGKPNAPVLTEKTANTVTLTAISGYEYSMDGNTWQTSNIFANLLPNKEYEFYQRLAETETSYASEKSASLTLTTLKNTVSAPGVPVIESKTDKSVVILATAGYEYSMDGNTWQTSNVFSDLSPDTEYIFYQRSAETETDYVSKKSIGIRIVTMKACEVDPALHVYDNACDADCNVCGAKRIPSNHVYDNDCDSICNVCGATRSVSAHVYTDSCDDTCDICGAARSVTHKFTKTTTVKATTSKDGYTLIECEICGKDKSKTVIPRVKSFSLSKAEYAYDGKVKTPSVAVKDSAGKALKKDTDYTVSYAAGRKSVGSYKVTVKLKGNYSGSKTLSFTVKPTVKTSASLLIGATSSIGAKSNKKITYSSSNKAVATVSTKGVITAKKAGTATISVKSGGITQKITVTVKTPYVKITGTASMFLKESVTLKAETNTGAKVKWSSSNTKVATVSSSGKVTGQKAGSATIYAKVIYKGKTYTGKYDISVKNPSLKLNKTALTIYVGDKYTLVATASPKVTVKFKSSDTRIATVSSSGVITPKDQGKATITAYFTYAGKTYQKTCAVTVKKSGYRILKNHIIKTGTTNSAGNKMIGFYDNRDSATYYTTIEYDSTKDCLIFSELSEGSIDLLMTFELKENQKTIFVKMTIEYNSSNYAAVTYTLDVPSYYNGAGFTYSITTKGLLKPDDYKNLIGTYNKLGFIGWNLLLSAEGSSLNDIGFVNY